MKIINENRQKNNKSERKKANRSEIEQGKNLTWPVYKLPSKFYYLMYIKLIK